MAQVLEAVPAKLHPAYMSRQQGHKTAGFENEVCVPVPQEHRTA